jgi:hypothetical protein
MKSIFLIFISFFMLLSCSNSDDSFTPQNITPILIGKGSLMGSEGINPQNLVINNQQDWNNIINLIDQFRLAQFTETTNVDFNNFQLIAVFDNIYQSPTYDVTISSIIENQNNIVVTVTKTLNPSDATVVDQKFHIVKIPKSTKPILFQ